MVPCNAHWKPVFCKVPVRSFQLRDQNEIFEIVRIVCALTVWRLNNGCSSNMRSTTDTSSEVGSVVPQTTASHALFHKHFRTIPCPTHSTLVPKQSGNEAEYVTTSLGVRLNLHVVWSIKSRKGNRLIPKPSPQSSFWSLSVSNWWSNCKLDGGKTWEQS